jgi:hypothetical protein
MLLLLAILLLYLMWILTAFSPFGGAWNTPTVVNNVNTPVTGYNTASVNIVLVFGTGNPISSSYTDIATLTFNILDNEEILDFDIRTNDGGFGNTVITLEDNSTPVSGGNTFDQVVYDGSSWSGGNGVNGAPDATDAAKEIIVQSGTAALTGDVECEYFTVAAGADLVVGPNATLRPFVQDGSVGYNIADGVDGFLIDADATGYGQYMGPAVPGQINQYIGTDAGWRNIGFPVSGGTALTIGGGAANYSAASTSFNASPTCDGAWGNEISTVSVYRFNQGAAIS